MNNNFECDFVEGIYFIRDKRDGKDIAAADNENQAWQAARKLKLLQLEEIMEDLNHIDTGMGGL